MSVDALGPEWHISEDGLTILKELVGESHSTNRQKLTKTALDVDIKNIGKTFLTNELTKGRTSKIVLQIQKIRNISAPKANEGSQAAPRMLKLTLTDGESYAQAIELTPINAISRDKTPPGTKVVINSAKICGGYLLLSPENCTVLGGQVPHMVEKWLLAKSIQQSHNRKASNDGAPPWVEFGSKLLEENQEGAFKSLGRSENKDLKSDSSEFDQQRKEAIAEASLTAVKRTFGGRAKQNVQPNSINQRGNFSDRGRGKFSRRDGQRAAGSEDYEAPERPQKPAEKVSLFDFLSDKLPITETKTQEAPSYKKTSNYNQFNSNRQNYQKDNNQKDSNSYKYEQNNPTPSQASKGYSKTKEESAKTGRSYGNDNKNYDYKNDTQSKGQPSYNQQKSTYRDNESKSIQNKYSGSKNNYSQQNKSSQNNYSDNKNNYNQPTRSAQNNYSDNKKSYDKNDSTSQSYNKYNSNKVSTQNSSKTETSAIKNDLSKTETNQPQTSQASLTLNKIESSAKSYNTQQENSSTRITSNTSNYSNNSNRNAYSDGKNNVTTTPYGQNRYQNEAHVNSRQPTPSQPPPPNFNINQMTQDMSKMSLNSEFAKRSLKNHLNIFPPQTGRPLPQVHQRVVPPQPAGPPMMVPVVPVVNNFVPNNQNVPVGLQIGQECMAKYWEDGRFYNAIITGVTDRTFVVKFRDYGNIEEVFKNDCFSAGNQFQGNHQFPGNQYRNPYVQAQPYNNGYIGK